MTLRATVYESAQLGVEDTAAPGAAVDAEHLIYGLSIGDPSPQGGFAPFRADGSKYSTAMRRGKEHLTLPYSMAGCYNALTYLLDSLLIVADVDEGEVALQDTAYYRTYTPTADADTYQTYTVERGSSVRAWKAAWAVFNSLQFQVQANSEDLTFSGNMLAKYFTDNISMTAAPDAIPYVPIQPDHWEVSIASTKALLDDATALSRVISISFNHGDKFSPAFGVSRDNFWRGVSEGAPELGGEITLEAAATEMGWLDTYVRALLPVWIRLEAVGEAINDDYNYTFQVDMLAYLSALPALADADGVYGVTYQFTLVKDASLGAPFSVYLVNTVAELAPPA